MESYGKTVIVNETGPFDDQMIKLQSDLLALSIRKAREKIEYEMNNAEQIEKDRIFYEERRNPNG